MRSAKVRKAGPGEVSSEPQALRGSSNLKVRINRVSASQRIEVSEKEETKSDSFKVVAQTNVATISFVGQRKDFVFLFGDVFISTLQRAQGEGARDQISKFVGMFFAKIFPSQLSRS